MNHIYHHRVSVGEYCGIALFAVLAFVFLWQREGYAAYVGLFCMFMTFVSIERVIHTTYIITADGWLECRYGRFSGKRRIRVGDILSVRRQATTFRLGHYLLIEYGAHHLLSVSPQEEERFVSDIKKQL